LAVLTVTVPPAMTTRWNVHGQHTLSTSAESVVYCQIKALRQGTGDISFFYNVAQFCRKKLLLSL